MYYRLVPLALICWVCEVLPENYTSPIWSNKIWIVQTWIFLRLQEGPYRYKAAQEETCALIRLEVKKVVMRIMCIDVGKWGWWLLSHDDDEEGEDDDDDDDDDDDEDDVYSDVWWW